ncbi:MAG: hypothetical protein BWY61_00585 [Firmicutes bacterium ADurb.Bin354]|nr:MAG: hypothetical protein BWY61_00585 [Firmicutes bacterium ADurb.Bin354]
MLVDILGIENGAGIGFHEYCGLGTDTGALGPVLYLVGLDFLGFAGFRRSIKFILCSMDRFRKSKKRHKAQ